MDYGGHVRPLDVVHRRTDGSSWEFNSPGEEIEFITAESGVLTFARRATTRVSCCSFACVSIHFFSPHVRIVDSTFTQCEISVENCQQLVLAGCKLVDTKFTGEAVEELIAVASMSTAVLAEPVTWPDSRVVRSDPFSSGASPFANLRQYGSLDLGGVEAFGAVRVLARLEHEVELLRLGLDRIGSGNRVDFIRELIYTVTRDGAEAGLASWDVRRVLEQRRLRSAWRPL